MTTECKEVKTMSDNMYKIEIITRRESFDDLKSALNAVGVQGMTVYKVEGCGAQSGYVTTYRGVKREVQLLPKIKVDVYVSEIPYEKVLEAVREALFTGEVGDGKVFVTEVCDALRVRTGERGKDAFRGPCEA